MRSIKFDQLQRAPGTGQGPRPAPSASTSSSWKASHQATPEEVNGAPAPDCAALTSAPVRRAPDPAR